MWMLSPAGIRTHREEMTNRYGRKIPASGIQPQLAVSGNSTCSPGRLGESSNSEMVSVPLRPPDGSNPCGSNPVTPADMACVNSVLTVIRLRCALPTMLASENLETPTGKPTLFVNPFPWKEVPWTKPSLNR
jgi:hypothetical protein